MFPLDTTAHAHEAQLAVYRRMPLGERMRLVLEMMDEGFELARDGIRMRHPEYDEQQVFLAFVRLLHGDELYAKVWPGQPRLDP